MAAEGGRCVTHSPFEYAVIRAVPRVQRGEFINVGVLLYCQQKDFLGARVHLDTGRLHCLDPNSDVADVDTALRSWERTCTGEGPAVVMKPGERFRWLTAPRSTIIQAGPVHTGITVDPAKDLDRLLDLLVL
ncbi:DUF3037 domain-containing protein [Pseudonocardiaceae bacterium YIM PH 21723]|nr:DUF3037 domain-containing protein [Pseudonocardiaceae bacterium YIM PH 21723]